MPGKLYVVGTPIGNLKDVSQRAIETFKFVDFIAAEDTRVTMKLLNHLNIKKSVLSYFEHNKQEKGKVICEKILEGKNCALVSDAGMPCISDPGEYLVEKCINFNIKIEVVPGPCAISSALSLAGIFGTRFTFEGFLSVNKKNRKKHLEQIKNELRTMVFYESPHKLYRTLCDLYEYLGNRKIVLVKEITKIYENTDFTTLEEAVFKYKDKSIKGEFVVIIKSRESKEDDNLTLKDAMNLYSQYILAGESKLDAIKKVSKETSIKRSLIYSEVLKSSFK